MYCDVLDSYVHPRSCPWLISDLIQLCPVHYTSSEIHLPVSVLLIATANNYKDDSHELPKGNMELWCVGLMWRWTIGLLVMFYVLLVY